MEENTEVTGSPVIITVLAQIPASARSDNRKSPSAPVCPAFPFPPPDGSRRFHTRNSRLMPRMAVENTRAVGFSVHVRKKEANPYARYLHSLLPSFKYLRR